MRYKYILFDLDGTLLDSGEGIMSSAEYAFKQLGIKVPERSELRKMVGPPLRKSFPILGVPEEKVEEAVRIYRDKYDNQGGKYQNRIYLGIEDTLGKLKESGCILYVATSKPEAVARDILSKFELDKYFEYIAGASFDHSRESKSDVLEYLLGTIGNRQETVLVGDTNFDVEGAMQQKIPCIGVSWGYGSAEDMKSAGAETIVDSPEELLEYLKIYMMN